MKAKKGQEKVAKAVRAAVRKALKKERSRVARLRNMPKPGQFGKLGLGFIKYGSLTPEDLKELAEEERRSDDIVR